MKQGNNDLALDYFQQSIKKVIQKDFHTLLSCHYNMEETYYFKEITGVIYTSIADIYVCINNFNKALEYCLKVLKTYQGFLPVNHQSSNFDSSSYLPNFSMDYNSSFYIPDFGNNRILKWNVGAATGQIIGPNGDSGKGSNQL
ncbi:unnamed protein product [Didymodactylos carnosus]|uniref:Tetratricopeptide repeat protein n=1 Tax=Didymodactylos carnosus TaxID=1234261 RepID=A0A815I4Z9_9BILA|nr:unnamed protein product [Didymodactylos carnosus]CAF1363005.1 unnamed protein product [Didymodactylos carnosus]CAF3957400.1 unnamed protein product [Didymodactylos carnosus]CAF4243097.1 unnamed protein product [Didymodactylos carnosus]